MVRAAAVRKVNAHEPDGALPKQLSPELAFTVTEPEGVRVSPTCGDTEKFTVTAWPTTEGLGTTEMMLVVVVAFTPVPLRDALWVLPGVPLLSSVKVRSPVSGPVVVGMKVTDSMQLAPTAKGEAVTQLVVVE